MDVINQSSTNIIKFTDKLILLNQHFSDSDDFFLRVSEKLLAENLVTTAFLHSIALRERISYRVSFGTLFNCYSSYRYRVYKRTIYRFLSTCRRDVLE